MRRFQKAASEAAAHDNISIDLTFTPFILRRHLPKEGVSKLEMFSAAMGGEANARAKFAQIKGAAEDDGLCLDFDGQRAGNSEDAHRLLLWASATHGQRWLPLLEALFRKYNCDRQWIGDVKVLTDAAEAAGLPSSDAAELLHNTSAFSDTLEAGLARSAELGTSGVPLFVVDGRATLPGAVPATELLAAIRAASRSPLRLAQWYVERANAHDIAGLAEMLAVDVDMFGGPCDRSGLDDFFAMYPQVHWQVTSAYAVREDDPNTVVFEYTRTWMGPDGARLAVDAAEAITFDGAGHVSRIAYTLEPSATRSA